MNGRTRPGALTWVLLTVAMFLCGCGGGGGGGSTSRANAVGPITTQPSSHGTVSILVIDGLGAPVPGAGVVVNSDGGESRSGVTDANGRYTVMALAPSWISAYAYGEYEDSFSGSTDALRLVENGFLDLTISVTPSAPYGSAGIADATVVPGGLAADGRSLELGLRLVYIAGSPTYLWPPPTPTIDACTPDASNDAPSHVADCVEGVAGFDAPYEGALWGMSRPAEIPGTAPAPFTALFLLDQSRHITANDPRGARLFYLKFMLAQMRATNRIALAAFAADDTATSETSPLPQQPVTVFPIVAPQFVAPSHDLFPTIDALEQLEGGIAPLYLAISAMLDFTAAHTQPTERRAVVVLTDGHDDACGSAQQCEAASEAVLAKSRALGVPIIALGIVGEASLRDRQVLSRVTQQSGGLTLWADSATHLGIQFVALNRILDGSTATYSTDVTIQSSTDGAFASGRTVFGTLDLGECPWECYNMKVPFAVNIP